MQITFDKLSELSGLAKNTCRLYMDGWRLSKYIKMQFKKRGNKIRKIYTINFSQQFIDAFAEFMKIRLHNNTEFKRNAEELLRGKNK